MNFEQTRALVEDRAREFGGKWLSSDLDIVASCVMAERDGMVLHSKVNDAREKAIVGRIWNAKGYCLFTEAHLLRGIIRARSPGRRTVEDMLMESIVNELCDGDLLAKERQAFFNRQSNVTHDRVIEAYRRAIHDDGGAPTLPEVHAELDQDRKDLLDQGREDFLPREWKLRRMVTHTFHLPLSKAKRGPRRRN